MLTRLLQMYSTMRRVSTFRLRGDVERALRLDGCIYCNCVKSTPFELQLLLAMRWLQLLTRARV